MSKFVILAAALGALLALQSTVVDCNDGEFKVKGVTNYDRINNYLIDHVNSDDHQENAKAAEQWLSKMNAVQRLVLGKEVKKIADLKYVGTPNNCHQSIYRDWKKFASYTGQRIYQEASKRNRYENVVYNAIAANSKVCKSTYPRLFKYFLNVHQQSTFGIEASRLLAHIKSTAPFDRKSGLQSIQESSKLGEVLYLAFEEAFTKIHRDLHRELFGLNQKLLVSFDVKVAELIGRLVREAELMLEIPVDSAGIYRLLFDAKVFGWDAAFDWMTNAKSQLYFDLFRLAQAIVKKESIEVMRSALLDYMLKNLCPADYNCM